MKGQKEWWKHMSENEKKAFIKDRAKYRHGIDTSIGRKMLLSYLLPQK